MMQEQFLIDRKRLLNKLCQGNSIEVSLMLMGIRSGKPKAIRLKHDEHVVKYKRFKLKWNVFLKTKSIYNEWNNFVHETKATDFIDYKFSIIEGYDYPVPTIEGIDIVN